MGEYTELKKQAEKWQEAKDLFLYYRDLNKKNLPQERAIVRKKTKWWHRLLCGLVKTKFDAENYYRREMENKKNIIEETLKKP